LIFFSKEVFPPFMRRGSCRPRMHNQPPDPRPWQKAFNQPIYTAMRSMTRSARRQGPGHLHFYSGSVDPLQNRRSRESLRRRTECDGGGWHSAGIGVHKTVDVCHAHEACRRGGKERTRRTRHSHLRRKTRSTARPGTGVTVEFL